MANSADSNLNPHTYTMNGVEVSFPAKAYPSQVAMMSKIIGALQRGQNSLLESPTGSGKSLALLCAALAWQKKETEVARAYNIGVDQGLIEPEDAPPLGSNLIVPDDENDPSQVAGEAGAGFFRTGDDDDDDFVDQLPNRLPLHQRHIPFPVDQVTESVEPGSRSGHQQPLPPRKLKKKTVPKIYFGTRTHKQIAQIIRELKKTAYKDVKMTILASREHTCINKAVMQMKNKTEGCRELTDRKNGMGCNFQSNVKSKMANHHAVNSYRGTSDAWDLEDIVKLGKKVRACPYYGTRELKNRSQIIFCPYNYLVEPLIRKSMDIDLRGQIVILDEAHNIEDSARSAASWEVSQEEVQAAMQDLERVINFGIGQPEAHREMAQACSKLSGWIDAFRDKLVDYTDFNSSSKVWTGTEVVALFQHHGFGPENFDEIQRNLNKVLEEWQSQISTEDEERQGQEENKDTPKLKTSTVDVLENFALVLGHLYMKEQKYRDDFRVALVKTQSRKQGFRAAAGRGGWMGKGDTGGAGGPQTILGITYTVNFWCLNPAVTFDDLKESVRSIILTSGTLSPMGSFSSELDVRFPIQLEANHVIDKKQVWIGTLSHGPTGHCLNATFKNAESFGFQDELGRMTLNVCQTIAHGVLLFLPSYRMLQNLADRWQRTGIWADICQKKVIITEPKNSAEFEASIRHFNEVIETTTSGCQGQGTVDGALFIAVCRGKVSEGLDFADNNARAVICVGIPFPNVKDIQVDLKMRYNDNRRNAKKEDILSGKDWYEIQAFRALNQALGRCIRHRRDWGAIIMVDDRFSKNTKYLNSLSRWVRSGVVHYHSHPDMMNELAIFNRNMIEMDRQHEEQMAELAKAAAAAASQSQRSNSSDNSGPLGLSQMSQAFKLSELKEKSSSWARERIKRSKGLEKKAEVKQETGSQQHFRGLDEKKVLKSSENISSSLQQLNGMAEVKKISAPEIIVQPVEPEVVMKAEPEVVMKTEPEVIVLTAEPEVTSIPESPNQSGDESCSSPKMTRIPESPTRSTPTVSPLKNPVARSVALSASRSNKRKQSNSQRPSKRQPILFDDESDDDFKQSIS